jgi:hypothetical protein
MAMGIPPSPRIFGIIGLAGNSGDGSQIPPTTEIPRKILMSKSLRVKIRETKELRPRFLVPLVGGMCCLC